MREKLKGINYLCLFLVATVSFLWFFFRERTAYDWPATDIVPMINRYFDSSYLVTDFFTNASSNEPNPRWPFVYLIVGISELFRVDWYVVLYILKLLLIIFTPVLSYLVIYLINHKYTNKENLNKSQIFILLGVIIVIYPPVSGLFSIAWWRPFFIQATPQSLAIFLGLTAIVIKELDLKYSNYISILIFAIGTLIHPANGLFLIVFHTLSNYKNLKSEYKYYLGTYILGFVLTGILLKVFFGPKNALTAAEFVDIYCIKTHPFHYHFSEFQSMTPYSWMYSFWLMFILMIIPLISFYRSQEKWLVRLSIVFLLSFVFAVVAQYVFIDLLPMKIIATIGPVRFTQLTYWMIVILWIGMLSKITFLHKFKLEFNFKKPFFILVFGYVIIGIYFIDSPEKNLYTQDKDVYEFLEKTSKESVYCVAYGEFSHSIQNIGKRAVFVSNGFPFNEDYFKEYTERTSLIFGNKIHEDRMNGLGINNYYRKLTPEKFYKIYQKRRLDYVVVEKEFSSEFSKYKPIFENKKICIYSVSELKKKK